MRSQANRLSLDAGYGVRLHRVAHSEAIQARQVFL
jgi:hypothetical protein